MTGTRNTVDGLWDVPSSKSNKDHDVCPPQPGPRQEHKLSVIIRKRKTHTDLSRYLHACLFSPVATTLIKAIDRNALATFHNVALSAETSTRGGRNFTGTYAGETSGAAADQNKVCTDGVDERK